MRLRSVRILSGLPHGRLLIAADFRKRPSRFGTNEIIQPSGHFYLRSAALRASLRRKEESFSALYGTAEAVP